MDSALLRGVSMIVLTATGDFLDKTKASDAINFSFFSGWDLDLSYDQSSSATGLNVWEANSRKNLMALQINNTYDMRLTSFCGAVKFITRNIVKGANVKNLVLEDIHLGRGGLKGYEALAKVKGNLEELQDESKEFYESKFYSSKPAQWRSGFLDGIKQGKNAAEKKLTVRNKVIGEYPDMAKFIPYSAPDWDVFESYGIYKGCMAKYYAEGENGQILKKVNTSITKLRSIVWDAYYLDDADINTNNISKLVGCPVVQVDTELDLEETVVRAPQLADLPVWFKVNRNEEVWLALRSGMFLQEGKSYVVVCGRK